MLNAWSLDSERASSGPVSRKMVHCSNTTFMFLLSIVATSYPDPPSTTLHKTTTTVTVREGDSVNISCASAGNPIPAVSWELDGFPAPFPQKDSVTQYQVENQQLGFIQGNVSSVLMVSKATYPEHNGPYTCFGSNSHNGRTRTNSVTITVDVLGMCSTSHINTCSCVFVSL